MIIPPSRPPVLLQITNHAILAGTVADAAPKRIFPYKQDDDQVLNTVETAYRFWSCLLQQVYDNLGQDTKDRRAVVLVPDVTLQVEYIRINLQKAMLRVLLDVIGVPSVSIQPTMLFLPYAFPMLRNMIVVHVTTQNASTFVHSNDASLPFTFHSVPLEEDKNNDKTGANVISTEWTTAMERQYLDPYYPQSLMAALLKTLENCPLPIRGLAVQNLVFTGQGVSHRPDIPLRVCKRLKQLLQAGKLPDEPAAPPETGPYPNVVGMVPVALSALKPLASLVGLIDTAATLGSSRADLVPWTGASLWASHSHQHNEDAFQWISKNVEQEP